MIREIEPSTPKAEVKYLEAVDRNLRNVLSNPHRDKYRGHPKEKFMSAMGIKKEDYDAVMMNSEYREIINQCTAEKKSERNRNRSNKK